MGSGQEVVLKVVFPDPDLDRADGVKEKAPSQSQLDSFRREIDILSVIDEHPNISALLGITQDFRVLVLQEAVIDLEQMIKARKQGLPLRLVLSWTHELLLGVHHLHTIGIMHRDLKPANLLLHRDMALKICDFGLSCFAASSEAVPIRRETTTLWYRAPELIMGAEQYSSLIDLWSVGCIILQMLVGKCVTAGRVEKVCKCPKKTHFNFNEDQLGRIFRLVGSPSDEAFLCKMDCRAHFQGWPTYPSKLKEVVIAALNSEDRSRSSGTIQNDADFLKLFRPKVGTHAIASVRQFEARLPQSPRATEEDVCSGQWCDLLHQLMQTDPAARITAQQALAHPIWDSLPAAAVSTATARGCFTAQKASVFNSVLGAPVKAARGSGDRRCPGVISQKLAHQQPRSNHGAKLLNLNTATAGMGYSGADSVSAAADKSGLGPLHSSRMKELRWKLHDSVSISGGPTHERSGFCSLYNSAKRQLPQMHKGGLSKGTIAERGNQDIDPAASVIASKDKVIFESRPSKASRPRFPRQRHMVPRLPS